MVVTHVDLTPRQLEILRFVHSFIQEHSYAPTVREIGEGLRISSTSDVDYNLRVLGSDGFLLRKPAISRGIVLTEEGKARLQGEIYAVQASGNG